MLKKEFPNSSITNNNALDFLFSLAGYSYNKESFIISKRPSKFGGCWETSEDPSSLLVNKNQTSSLLENQQLIDFIHQPLCDKCQAVWQCSLISQKNTNGEFKLLCPKCGYIKYWSTQKKNFLDDLLWMACRLTGSSPTKLNHILRILNTGYDSKQHHSGELFQKKVVPTINSMYLEMREKIFKEVKGVCEQKKIKATITWDGGYASRNNNSDHAVVDFVEHVTGKNLMLHLETTQCSSSLLPQSAEKELIKQGYTFVKSQIPIARVGHDGKEIKDVHEIDPDVAEDLDPWHFKKGEMHHYKEFCIEKTKCIRGNKKKGIKGDTKEVIEMKMRRRNHLLKLEKGLGFHLLRCCKWSAKSVYVAELLWHSYLLHCMGCHIFCFDENEGISTMGKSPCAKNENEQTIYTEKEYQILQEFLSNTRIQKAFPRLVYFTCSYPNESIWNVMGLYRDKTIHYKYYDTLYQMGYLDWNENRMRKVKYKYETKVREWKTRHKKRYNRKVLEEKTYLWQYKALAQIFPDESNWFTCTPKGEEEEEEEEDGCNVEKDADTMITESST